MQYIHKLSRGLMTVALLATAAVTYAADAPKLGVWQHHQTTLNYFGITALYTCDGLEDKVRALLLYFGARSDLKVSASGCPRGSDHPSSMASVSTDFYSLAPADAGVPDTVSAHWSGVRLTPQRPIWMGAGECELVDQLKSLLTKSFSMRDVQYRTSCAAHQITIADYRIEGEVLKSAGGKPG